MKTSLSLLIAALFCLERLLPATLKQNLRQPLPPPLQRSRWPNRFPCSIASPSRHCWGTSGYGLLPNRKPPSSNAPTSRVCPSGGSGRPVLVLVAPGFIKDTAGSAMPTAVKKPFDIGEAF